MGGEGGGRPWYIHIIVALTISLIAHKKRMVGLIPAFDPGGASPRNFFLMGSPVGS